MTAVLLTSIYMIGCLLCYWKCLAHFYEIDEKYWMLPPSKPWFEFLLSLTSWLGFLSATVMYFMENNKYFFKFNRKKLWENYYEFIKQNPEWANL